MQNTGFLFPQTIISNNGWTNPGNIQVSDGSYAVSNATNTNATDFVCGNFLFNIPTNAVISGIEIEVKGKRGVTTSPATTLEIWAYDNTNDSNFLYQYTPSFSSFDIVDGVYTFGSNTYTFNQTLTADQVNNLKFKIVANGEVYIDTLRSKIYYAQTATSTPIVTTECQPIIQAQKFALVRPISSTDTTALLNRFQTPDGVLITNAHISPQLIAIGRGIPLTIDQSLKNEENVFITNINHLTSGQVEITITRGWSFIDPISQNANLQKTHAKGAEVAISNSQPFYDIFLRKCHIGSLVSAPIVVEDESTNITNYLRKLNFKGSGVIATATPAITGGGDDIDVTINGYGNQPIQDIDTTSVSSGGNQVTTLTSNILSSGTDTELIVSVTIESGKTVTSVTYNSVPLVNFGSQNQNDLRVEGWHLVNPPSGTHAIVATFSSDTYSCFEAVTKSGVNQITPIVGTIGNAGNSLSSNGTVTTLDQNSTILHLLGTREIGMTFTSALGETINSTSTSGVVQGSIASRLIGTPSTQNTQINLSISNDWANLVFALQPTPVLPPIITSGQSNIQFQDEGVNLGTTGTVDTLDFIGAGVTATRSGNTVTVDIPGGGSGGSATSLEATVTQTAHGFVVGDVIKVSGTNTFAKAQGNNEINSEAVGIVTTLVSANSFKYISSAIQLSIAPIGTPGSAVWLDPSVAGGMTTTKPSTIGQVARALGTIIESGAKMYFDIAALAEVIGTGSGGSTNFFSTSTPSYGLISPDTGSTAVLELSDGTLFSYPVGTYNNYCITADKTKVYKATITYTIGSNYTISLEEYIGNANGSIGTLAVTYTGTGAHTVGTNNFEGGIFVDGNKVFIPLANGTSLKFFTEWTLSGTSLTSPLTTNLNYSTLTNFVNFYWFYDGTYYYTYNNAANDLITKWTYSAGTFTSVATASLSTSIDTQTSYGTAIGVDPRMKLLFFRIVTGKIGNFGMLVTTGSTFSAPKFVSGVIYLENSSI